MLNKLRCVPKCPKKDSTGKYFLYQNDLTGECMKTKEQDPFHKEKYLFPRSLGDLTSKSILFDTIQFTRKSVEYLMRDREELASQQSHSGDKDCYFKGKVKERLSVEKETYFECDCEEGFFGSRCQISKGLYEKANIFIKDILKDVSC